MRQQKNVADNAWQKFIGQFGGDVASAICVMYQDLDHYKVNDSRVDKLLRLASCPASPMGEKTNAAKMAFGLLNQRRWTA